MRPCVFHALGVGHQQQQTIAKEPINSDQKLFVVWFPMQNCSANNISLRLTSSGHWLKKYTDIHIISVISSVLPNTTNEPCRQITSLRGCHNAGLTETS